MTRKLLRRADYARTSFFLRPLPCLAAHFFTRFFDSELVSGDGDNSLSIGGVFAIFAVPGLLAPLLLFAKYSSFGAWLTGQWRRMNVWQMSLADQYLLITWAMTVTGIATVIKWDSLFPDRRDFAALAPLPLSLARIFYAKVFGLAALLLFFIIDVNGPSSVVFPMIFIAGWGNFTDYVRFTATHVLAIAAASAFTFLFFIAIAGVFQAVLPPRWFVRASRYVRTVAVVSLLSLFLTAFAVSDVLVRGHWPRLVRMLPPVWFVALSRALFGRPTFPVFPELARLATWSLLIVFVAAAIAYALSYRRYFMKIPESIDAPAGEYSRVAAALWRVIERLLPGRPAERACAIFAMKTIVRSEKHWLILGGSLGLAVTIASESIAGAPLSRASVPPAPVLAFPLVVIFFLISGLRFVFAMPSELRANWIFRTCGDLQADTGPRIARLVMLALIAPFLILICVPVYAAAFGLAMAAAHTMFAALLSLVLADVALAGYRSIPFTCSWAPGKGNPAFSIGLYTLAFFLFASLMSAIEHWILASVVRYAVMAGVIVAAWLWWKHEAANGEEPDAVLLYEDRREPAVQTLNLS